MVTQTKTYHDNVCQNDSLCVSITHERGSRTSCSAFSRRNSVLETQLQKYVSHSTRVQVNSVVVNSHWGSRAGAGTGGRKRGNFPNMESCEEHINWMSKKHPRATPSATLNIYPFFGIENRNRDHENGKTGVTSRNFGFPCVFLLRSLMGVHLTDLQ